MEKNTKTSFLAALGLGIAVIAILSAGTVYSMMGLAGTRQGASPSGMTGGYGRYGGMMGTGSGYSGGMMGGFSGMMGSVGMMSQCSQYRAGNFNHSSNSTAGGSFIAIVNGEFYPTSLTVTKGTTVTWMNMDFVQHTVTSGSEQAPTGLFDSHELGHMQSFSYTFSTPGTYTYYCDVHPGMTGTIVVN